MSKEKVYKVKVFDIDYYVGWEDVESNFDVPEDLDDDDLDEWFEIKIDEIKDLLPKTLTVEVEAEPDDLEDIVCDTVSDITGWLLNSFNYEIIK
jgi:hypothetical protein